MSFTSVYLAQLLLHCCYPSYPSCACILWYLWESI